MCMERGTLHYRWGMVWVIWRGLMKTNLFIVNIWHTRTRHTQKLKFINNNYDNPTVLLHLSCVSIAVDRWNRACNHWWLSIRLIRNDGLKWGRADKNNKDETERAFNYESSISSNQLKVAKDAKVNKIPIGFQHVGIFRSNSTWNVSICAYFQISKSRKPQFSFSLGMAFLFLFRKRKMRHRV